MKPIALFLLLAPALALAQTDAEWARKASWQQLLESDRPPIKKAAQAVLARSEKDSRARGGICADFGRDFRARSISPSAIATESFLRNAKWIGSSDEYGARNKQVSPLMTVCGAFSAWGMASKINYTATVSGTRMQLVFPGGRYVYANDSRFSAMILTVQQ